MSDDKNVRHRFTVPSADVIVNEWIEAQSNLGFSLRVLIKAFVRQYGVQDATCLELGVSVKSPGRPPKSATIGYDNMIPSNTSNATNNGAVQTVSPVQTQSVPVQAQESVAKPVTKTVQEPAKPQTGSGSAVNFDEQIDMNNLGL